MHALIETALYILWIYEWIVIAAVVSSWLLNFGVINRYNRFAMQAIDIIERLTEPALRPLRRVLPDLGGIDISPMVLFVIIFFLQRLIVDDIAPLLFRAPY